MTLSNQMSCDFCKCIRIDIICERMHKNVIFFTGLDMWSILVVQSEQHDIQIDGRQGPGRHKLTYKKLTENDCSEWKLMTVDSPERST